MAVVRLVRFTVDPASAGELVARRNAVVAATRERYPGLAEARLTRVDSRVWLDIWRWESLELAEAAVRGAHDIPGVAEAFALTSDVSAEFAEVVDER